jgi:hypothetical protein
MHDERGIQKSLSPTNLDIRRQETLGHDPGKILLKAEVGNQKSNSSSTVLGFSNNGNISSQHTRVDLGKVSQTNPSRSPNDPKRVYLPSGTVLTGIISP